MLNKQQVIQCIESLPEDFTMEDLIDRLILLDKIQIGLQQIENGYTFTTEEAKERLQKWF